VCLADVNEDLLAEVGADDRTQRSRPSIRRRGRPEHARGSRAADLVDAGRVRQIDILINNAGGGVVRPTMEQTEETLRLTLDRNLVDDDLLHARGTAHMMERRYGRVVSTGAESVRNGLWQHAVYNAAKAAFTASPLAWPASSRRTRSRSTSWRRRWSSRRSWWRS